MLGFRRYRVAIKAVHVLRNKIEIIFDSKMSGVQPMYFRFRQILQVRFSPLGMKKMSPPPPKMIVLG